MPNADHFVFWADASSSPAVTGTPGMPLTVQQTTAVEIGPHPLDMEPELLLVGFVPLLAVFAYVVLIKLARRFSGSLHPP
jgi:hypothetical protein